MTVNSETNNKCLRENPRTSLMVSRRRYMIVCGWKEINLITLVNHFATSFVAWFCDKRGAFTPEIHFQEHVLRSQVVYQPVSPFSSAFIASNKMRMTGRYWNPKIVWFQLFLLDSGSLYDLRFQKLFRSSNWSRILPTGLESRKTKGHSRIAHKHCIRQSGWRIAISTA